MSRTLTVYLAADLKKFGPQLRGAEQDLGRFGNAANRLGNTMSNMLGPAMIGAAAAAGYAAVKFGTDGVKAFVEDEAAAAKLATTMGNVGLAHDTTNVESMIDALQRETGVADDQLRPAFGKLVGVIGETAGATDALKLAMDISAGTGTSLESVVQKLSRAYGGSAGSLGKLVPELDKAILKSGDMDAITAALASRFSGQAKTAAETYQGQLSRLSVGFSELQESFGAGFLGALGATEGKTGDLMVAMHNLEPAMKNLGSTAATVVTGLANLVVASDKAAKSGKRLLDEPNWGDLKDLLIQVSGASEALTSTFVQGIPVIGPYINMIAQLTGAYDQLGIAAGQAGDEQAKTLGLSPAKQFAVLAEARRDQGRANRYAADTQAAYLHSLESTVPATNTATTGSKALTTANDDLTASWDTQTKVIDDLNKKLDTQSTKLEENTQKAKDYVTTLSGQLLGGIDLGAAQQTGTDLGISTLDAFDRQIAQAEWFGNVLSSIKAQGADQRLIDQLASLGPAAGGALAQEMLDKGLVQTFSDRLVDVVAVANTTAQAMVPEFLTAGIDSAEALVDGTIEQLVKEQARLKAIGKNVGKGIGVNIKAEIAEAVADAVRAANAAKTAAAAERASEIAAQQVVVSEQQIAQALQRLIGNSNARAGFSMGIPVPTPVLG